VILRAKEVKIEFARTEADERENESLERISLAVDFRKRGSETQILPARGSTRDAPPTANRPLIRAQIRAHRWRAVNLHKCGGQTQILPAKRSTSEALLAPNRTLIRALIRAHRWRTQLESGAVSSIDAIGRKENVNATYVGKLLSLAYLAPNLTEAILDGRQPSRLMVKHIRTIDIPLEWSAQRRLFSRFNE
jgi:hypothetical protein